MIDGDAEVNELNELATPNLRLKVEREDGYAVMRLSVGRLGGCRLSRKT